MTRENALQALASQIVGFHYLAPNWDTYGGLPAAVPAIRFSLGLLRELQTRPEISLPYICPIGTGVYIEWRTDAKTLYFEVGEDGVLFTTRVGDRAPEYGEDTLFDVKRAVGLVERFHKNAI